MAETVLSMSLFDDSLWFFPPSQRTNSLIRSCNHFSWPHPNLSAILYALQDLFYQNPNLIHPQITLIAQKEKKQLSQCHVHLPKDYLFLFPSKVLQEQFTCGTSNSLLTFANNILTETHECFFLLSSLHVCFLP